MRTHFYILFLLIGFTSCNDGDIIINSFDFENDALKSCEIGKSKVLFIINNDEIFETISLQANNTAFSDLKGVLAIETEENTEFALTGDNKLIYRTYDRTIPDTYFCSEIPPSSPKVIQEFKSVGGKVVITTIRNLEGITDRDGDTVKDVDELNEDTDGDGIMNILDVDDDGDNVLTKNETANANEDPVVNGLRNTDGDDTPNYLDPDDDGDGVPTKEEVTEASQDPNNAANFNDANLAHYLNPFISNRYTGEIKVLENKFDVRYQSRIKIENLQLQNQDGSGEVISFESYELGTFNSVLTPMIIAPTNTEEENN